MIRIAFIIISTEEKPWSEIHRNGQVPTWLAGLHSGGTEAFTSVGCVLKD